MAVKTVLNQLNENLPPYHNVSVAEMITYRKLLTKDLLVFTRLLVSKQNGVFSYFCLQRHRNHSTMRGVLPKWELCFFCRRFAMAAQAEQSIRGRLQHQV